MTDFSGTYVPDLMEIRCAHCDRFIQPDEDYYMNPISNEISCRLCLPVIADEHHGEGYSEGYRNGYTSAVVDAELIIKKRILDVVLKFFDEPLWDWQ